MDRFAPTEQKRAVENNPAFDKLVARWCINYKSKMRLKVRKSNIIQVAENFWNIRGSFKIAYVADIGTHASLVKLSNGELVFLDSYSFDKPQMKEIHTLSNDGKDISAIINLHPFHTVHVEKMHELFPNAKLYGTTRHLDKFPKLPWQRVKTEDPELNQLFPDFEFAVPQGVDFVHKNENVHFASVLAMHKASKTIHVDDTFMYVQPPVLRKWIELPAALSFHPTLAVALERKAGAADAFKQWAEELIVLWQDAENLCAAHTASLLDENNKSASIAKRMKKALRNVKPILYAHKKLYG